MYLLEKVKETGKQCGNFAAKPFLAINSPLTKATKFGKSLLMINVYDAMYTSF